jgi:hypothetical protein
MGYRGREYGVPMAEWGLFFQVIDVLYCFFSLPLGFRQSISYGNAKHNQTPMEITSNGACWIRTIFHDSADPEFYQFAILGILLAGYQSIQHK